MRKRPGSRGRWLIQSALGAVSIAALLTDAARHRLHSAMPRGIPCAWAADERELMHCLTLGGVQAIIFDPGCVSDPGMHSLAAVADGASCCLIVYTSLAAEPIIRAASVASRFGGPILYDYNDDPISLRRLLNTLPDLSAVKSFSELLHPAISSVTPSLRAAMESLTSPFGAANSSDELATRCNLTRRSVDRILARAGIRSATHLVNTARIVRGFGAMRNGWVPVSLVAAHLRLASARTLEAQCVAVTGADIAALRRMRDGTELCAQVAKRLFYAGNSTGAVGA